MDKYNSSVQNLVISEEDIMEGKWGIVIDLYLSMSSQLSVQVSIHSLPCYIIARFIQKCLLDDYFSIRYLTNEVNEECDNEGLIL